MSGDAGRIEDRLAAIYAQERAALGDAARAAWECKDLAALREIMHKLRPAASIMEEDRLAVLARQVHDACADGTGDTAATVAAVNELLQITAMPWQRGPATASGK